LRTQRAGSPFSVIEPKLVGVASNLDSVAVRIEKADGAVAGHCQDFRSAHDGNFSPPEHGIKLVYLLVRSDIDAEVVDFRYSLPSHVLRALRELHQGDVMVLSAEAHKSHLRAPVPGGDLHADDRAIEVLRFFQIRHVENDVAQDSVTYSHGRALIRRGNDNCQEHELPVVKKASEISPPRRGGRTDLGLASRVSGLGFELETQDAGLGTEKYLSLVNVIHCKTARAQYLKRLVSGAAEVGWFW
jgi:hypothetical protein